MARYRKSDYWELRKTRALRRETKNYVPLIHAAIVIAKAPERYGFVATPEARPAWEPVAVAGAYDLRVVAGCAGETVETLRGLNPELRRLATPADRTYDLRVPPGKAETTRHCLAELPVQPSAERARRIQIGLDGDVVHARGQHLLEVVGGGQRPGTAGSGLGVHRAGGSG